MFVVASDFDDLPFSLPHLEQQDNTFPAFVNEFEEVELRKLFGNAFYNAFVEGLAELPALWDGTAAYNIGDSVVYGSDIFIALQVIAAPVPPATTNDAPVDGVVWAVQPVNRWLILQNGAIFSDSDDNDSVWVGMKKMIIPMIYSLWTRYTMRTHTSAGIVTNDAENGSVVGAGIEISRGWRAYRMIALGVGFGRSYYYGFTGNSLLSYLYASYTTFADVTPVKYNDFRQYLAANVCDPGSENEFDL